MLQVQNSTEPDPLLATLEKYVYLWFLLFSLMLFDVLLCEWLVSEVLLCGHPVMEILCKEGKPAFLLLPWETLRRKEWEGDQVACICGLSTSLCPQSWVYRAILTWNSHVITWRDLFFLFLFLNRIFCMFAFDPFKLLVSSEDLRPLCLCRWLRLPE